MPPLVLIPPYKKTAIAQVVSSLGARQFSPTFDPYRASSPSLAYSGGDLTVKATTYGPWVTARTAVGVSSGKWYWEVYWNGQDQARCGFTNGVVFPYNTSDQNQLGSNIYNSFAVWNSTTGAYFESLGCGTLLDGNSRFTKTAGTYMFALDLDNYRVYVGKDGMWWNGTTNGTSTLDTTKQVVTVPADTYYPAVSSFNTYASLTMNFGATAFSYAAPTGFLPFVNNKAYDYWNPKDKAASATLSNNNLTYTSTSVGDGVRGRYGINSGRMVYEVTLDKSGTSYGAVVGFADAATQLNRSWNDTINDFYQIYVRQNSGASNAALLTKTGRINFGASCDTGDVLGLVMDLNLNLFKWYKNGVFQNSTSVTPDTYYPIVTDPASSSSGSEVIATANFGATPFKYSYNAYAYLNTKDKYADVVLSADCLTANSPQTNWYHSVRANKSVNAGKWVWEVTVNNSTSGWYQYPCSIATATAPLDKAFGYDGAGGYGINTNATTNSPATYTILLDMDARTMKAYRNGVLMPNSMTTYPNGTAVTTFPAGDYFPGVSLYSTDNFTLNFGDSTFKYPGIIPADYKPILLN